MEICKTYEVKIWIAGNPTTIETHCREFCLSGNCVTITPTIFTFTGGAEYGACIGLINYARFPKSSEIITKAAIELANTLMEKCCQRSCSIVTPEETYYLTNPKINIPR